MKRGAELIVDERARQINELGWTAEQDDTYEDDELTDAAVQYIAGEYTSCWPESWKRNGWTYNPSDDRVRDLQKAGALIAAEIDRLQRKRQREELLSNKK